MTTAREALLNHLGGGVTTTCRCWQVIRRDGVSYGFTDHDRDLEFEAQVFQASSGLSAGALQQTTGLSVDNTEAVGALSAAALTEEDLTAGRFDGAGVTAWLVNWANVAERMVEFRGSFGDVSRKAGGFRAELRGLTDRLNRPQGLAYHAGCNAVLGDARCRVDLTAPGNRMVSSFVGFDALQRLVLAPVAADARWFEQGVLRVTSGPAAGLSAAIKVDEVGAAGRVVTLWQALPAAPQPGDTVDLAVGCDRQAATCRAKFGNFLNFRGFPHIPGDDWLASYPVSSGVNDGGSLVG